MIQTGQYVNIIKHLPQGDFDKNCYYSSVSIWLNIELCYFTLKLLYTT